jgi:hypothetical protein
VWSEDGGKALVDPQASFLRNQYSSCFIGCLAVRCSLSLIAVAEATHMVHFLAVWACRVGLQTLALVLPGRDTSGTWLVDILHTSGRLYSSCMGTCVLFALLQRVSSTVCTAFCVMPVANSPHHPPSYFLQAEQTVLLRP